MTRPLPNKLLTTNASQIAHLIPMSYVAFYNSGILTDKADLFYVQ